MKYLLNRIYLRLSLGSFLLFQLISCQQTALSTLSADEFEEIIKVTGNKYAYTAAGRAIIDSISKAHPRADLDFKFKYLAYTCGYYHIIKGDQDSAMIYADSMLTLVNNRDNKENYLREEALANISIGDIHFARNNYRQAYQYYYLGKVAAEKSTDPCTYSEYNYRLGMVSFRQTNYLRAAHDFIRSFQKSANCAANYATVIRRQEILNNIALSYYKADLADSSIFYHKKTVLFLREHKDMFAGNLQFYETALGVTYGTAARAYALTDSAKAVAYYRESIAINTRPMYDYNDALATQLSFADFYIHHNNWDAVFAILQNAKHGVDSISNKEAATEWNLLMWKYYQQKEQKEQAYLHLVAYEALQKEQSLADKKLSKTTISSEIESLQSAYEINLLKKDKRFKNIMLLVLSAGVALIGIILSLIWQNWRRSKKQVAILQTMNSRISDQKAIINSANNQLRQQVLEKDTILRVVAHDLRNPISGIKASLNYLGKPARFSAGEMQFINIMQVACSDALTLISSLLEVTGRADQQDETPVANVSIHSIIYHCVQLLLFKASEKEQLIDIEFQEQDIRVVVREEQIRRVINNLLTNAIKFSQAGNSIKVSAAITGSFVKVSVQDQGIGIPQKLQAKVFDVATEAKRYGTGDEKPFGLGLSICKKIVEAHNGEIWLNSVEDQGTTFFFTLPLAGV